MSSQKFDFFTRFNEFVIAIFAFTIIWNICEGIVAIDYGIQCKSFSLFFLGINVSVCVIPPSLALREFIKKINSNEEKANSDIQDSIIYKNERKIEFMMMILFILLTTIIFTCAVAFLVLKQIPQTTFPGLIITSISLVITLLLWSGKHCLARKLDSSILSYEARYSLVCLEIIAIVFLSNLLYLILPNIWWLDSVATLIQGIPLIIEGFEMYARRKSNKTNEKDCRITITIEETTCSTKEQKPRKRQSSFGSGKRQSSFGSGKRLSSKLRAKINEGQNKEPESSNFLDITFEKKSMDIETLR
ncbi:13247_t:CDS:2 [Dentiscutata heterogama]|uniref:13247_t:CDS:1 n=1 Tax=Dentiscutata heterogama TaxID=1316150 RepID=A0ACA9MMH7_9GLOM|nr:13247_t:CDS:2 [Dentiscutata heterogama]